MSSMKGMMWTWIGLPDVMGLKESPEWAVSLEFTVDGGVGKSNIERIVGW